MKKLSVFLLVILLILSLTGCDALSAVTELLPGKETTAADAVTTTTAAETTAAEAEAEETTTTTVQTTTAAAVAAPKPIPSQLAVNGDGSYTLLLPVTEYMSEDREDSDTIHLEYDDYGIITRFWGEYLSDDEVLSEIEYDGEGRPVSVKLGIYDDEYRYSYDDNGTLIAIEGLMNSGERAFRFTRSDKPGAAYELTEIWPGSNQVLVYDAGYRQLERGSYPPDADPSTYKPAQRFTYDEYGRLAQWDWLQYEDMNFTYTAADFDDMGHCLPKNSVAHVRISDDSDETELRKSTRLWASKIETDAQGRVIRDTHTYADDPDTPYIIIYSYDYDGDALAGFTYTVHYPCLGDQFLEEVYKPVTLRCDELQLAFLMIYGQDLPINQANSLRGFDVDMAN